MTTKKKSLTDLENQPQAQQTDIEEEYLIEDEEYWLLKNHLPKGVDIKAAIEYGFYEFKNRYWMRRKGDTFEPISNFIIEVKYLIVGANPKRIVEIKNVHHKKVLIDFMIEDLISLEKFKGRVESQGNFLFEGKATDLARIKNKLYNVEKASLEITRLGQYKDRFYAFANGVVHQGQFVPIDDNGMIAIDGENFYIPVMGNAQNHDDEDMRNYRRFQHTPSPVTFRQWSSLFTEVYGDNGKIAIAFALYAMFSDVIFEKTKAAPMLFLFGQRGSGKGSMVNSLLYLFGTPQDPLMLGGASTVVGFMRKMGQFSNAIVWLDEYKNEIGEKKIESLKNIWDRVGYERGVKDASNKTQSTPVTSSAILSGQEMPTAEPALFSRTILCEFGQSQYNQESVNRFNALREMEVRSITSIVLQALPFRERVKTKFQEEYNAIASTLRSAFHTEGIIERVIVNYSILITMVKLVGEQLELPFTWQETLTISERYIARQNGMMATANEVQQFFEMVAFLLSCNLIDNGKDMMVKNGIIYLRLVSIIPLYREYSRRQGIRSIDRGTLLNYLQNSSAYLIEESKQGSYRFPKLQNPTNAHCFSQVEVERIYKVDFRPILQGDENQQDTPFTPRPDAF